MNIKYSHAQLTSNNHSKIYRRAVLVLFHNHFTDLSSRSTSSTLISAVDGVKVDSLLPSARRTMLQSSYYTGWWYIYTLTFDY